MVLIPDAPVASFAARPQAALPAAPPQPAPQAAPSAAPSQPVPPAAPSAPELPAHAPAAPQAAARPEATPPASEWVADPLAGVPLEIRSFLWRWLLRALDASVWDADGLLVVCRPTEDDLPEHLCPPPFAPSVLRDLAREALRRLLRVEVRLALEALEVFLLSRRPAASTAAFALAQAHCTHIGQLYSALRARVPELALLDLAWELRLLHHRGSGSVAPLLWGPEHAAHP